MPHPTVTAHDSATHHALRWAERVLIGAGVLLLAWAALLVVDQRVSQRLAREALQSVPPVGARVTDTARRPLPIARGAPIAELSIPRLRLSAVVLNGSDATTLRRGPGHIEQTALPGEPGNVAIAGHRDTFFRPIRNLQVGDDVFLDTLEGRFQYRVASLHVVSSNDTTVLAATRTPTLTLITCYPFWVAGPAPDRFVAQAVEVRRPAAALAASDEAHTIGTSTIPSSPDIAATAAALPAAPAAPPASASDRVHVPGVRAVSADLQVRAAIERFRGNYNARLTRRAATVERPLVFGQCDILFAAASARATCTPPTDADAAPPGAIWTFEFRESAGTWEMQSVEPN